ncbi:MAG: SMP-30/gluconolactonase/LRE family protein [Blautia sp.]|nr:SMP-30/gluconolactonase/LRE family protein [Blautia sp.]
MEAKLWIEAHCINAEGPVWDDLTQTFYFIDVEAGRIFSWKDQTLQSVSVGEKIGCAVLTREGEILAGMASGIYAMDFETGRKTLLTDPEPELLNNRFNDGKVDPRGRFYAGTMTMDAADEDPFQGALYRLEKEGTGFTARRVINGMGLSNGLAWSLDGKKFYLVDTRRSTVSEYEYDMETGRIGEGHVLIKVPKEMGFPDGMTIDEEGKLWVALWGGSAVSRWDPSTGRLLEKVELPALRVSSCCFGGEDMDQLFVTTASQDTDLSQYPLAGNVFVLQPGVRGVKSYRAAF